MKPLSEAKKGETHKIKWIFGEKNVVKFLESIGAEEGCFVTVIDKCKSDMLIRLNNRKIAIGIDAAARIQV